MKAGSTERKTVFTYLSAEEKQALEILAAVENRSSSNLIRFELVKILKERGLLEERIEMDGTVVQTVLTHTVTQ